MIQATKKLQLIGEIKTTDIISIKNDSFEIVIENLNEGKPIKLDRISDTLASFSQKFDDVDKYKVLIKK